MTVPICPHICVTLTGLDSNAMVLIAEVSRAMRKVSIPKAEIDSFVREAMSGDYDNVLQTCMKYVTVD
jgi:hypothetical protein